MSVPNPPVPPVTDAARLIAEWRENSTRSRANADNARIPELDRRQCFGVSQAYEQCADELEPPTASWQEERASAEKAQWTLDNVFTIARRELNRLGPDAQGQKSEPTVGRSREMWGHVLRLCEKAGCQSRGVLRDNGGSV